MLLIIRTQKEATQKFAQLMRSFHFNHLTIQTDRCLLPAEKIGQDLESDCVSIISFGTAR